MPRAAPVRRWTIALTACALLAWTVAHIVRRAAAELMLNRSGSLEEMERACATDPGRAACPADLAAARESVGQDGSAAWRRAIDLDPGAAPVLTQAALAAESRGDIAVAEKWLLQAERYSHTWLPRWTLANFYYRHQRLPEFWRSMRDALARSYGDRRAAFRLCRDAGATPAFLLENVLPPTPDILNAYVHFLIEEHETDGLLAAGMRYAATVPVGDRAKVSETLLAATEALLAADQPGPALQFWNLLCARRFIPYSRWDPQSPLVNGNFHPPLATPAFDWRTPATTGVMVLFGVPADGVKISLSGQQPEDAELLAQFVCLKAGYRYRFAFDYRTLNIAPEETGLRWRIGEYSSRYLAANEWQNSSLDFSVPDAAGSGLAKIGLIAARRAGHARNEGEIWIRRARLEAVR